MLSLIDPEILEQELTKSHTPILLAFFEKRKVMHKQTVILENLASALGDQLRVYLGDERYLKRFCETFDFQGTPFFLLLTGGTEKCRFYGNATRADLNEIIDHEIIHSV